MNDLKKEIYVTFHNSSYYLHKKDEYNCLFVTTSITEAYSWLFQNGYHKDNVIYE